MFGRRNGTKNQLLHALFETKVDSVGVLTFALEESPWNIRGEVEK